MNFQRNHRLSEAQLLEILRSLPQVNAPQNLEEQLLHRITAEHLNVAHVLASLTPVAAHPEFDERLFKAIEEQERSGGIITDPFVSGTSFATWLKSIGWMRGGIAAGVAVVMAIGGALVHNATLPDAEQGAQAPASTQLPASAPASISTPPSQFSVASPTTGDAISQSVIAEQAGSDASHPVVIRHRSAIALRRATTGEPLPPVSSSATLESRAKVSPAPAVVAPIPNAAGNSSKESVIEETGDSATTHAATPAAKPSTEDSINTGGDSSGGTDRTGGDTLHAAP